MRKRAASYLSVERAAVSCTVDGWTISKPAATGTPSEPRVGDVYVGRYVTCEVISIFPEEVKTLNVFQSVDLADGQHKEVKCVEDFGRGNLADSFACCGSGENTL